LKRWRNHGIPSNRNTPFNNAIQKYGRDNFSVEVLHVCTSKEEMDFVEMFYIALLNTKSPQGYNLTDGGEGCPGHTVSVEGRLRMISSHLGKKQTEETKKRRAASLRKAYAEGRRTGFVKGSDPWNKGLTGTFKHTEEAKRRIGVAAKVARIPKGTPWSPARRAAQKLRSSSPKA
jgi:group I intron endonuclease